MWKTEPGPGSRARRNGQPEQPTMENDRLLDHHIEEILGTFMAAAQKRETAPGPEEQPHD